MGLLYIALGCGKLLLRTTCTTFRETPSPYLQNDSVWVVLVSMHRDGRHKAVLRAINGQRVRCWHVPTDVLGIG